MKSERRHQLETNILADWLGKNLEGVEEHKTTIAAVFAIIVAVALVFVFVVSSGGSGESAAQWNAYYNAFANPDPTPVLEGFVEKNKTATPAVLWAKKTLADRYLGRGTSMLFLNRKEALEKLEEAEKLYTEIERGAGNNNELRNQAQFGKARILETVGRADDAKTLYTSLVKLGNESALGKASQDALNRLQNPRTTEALAWLAEQKPNLPKGHPTIGGGLGEVPDRPDLTFPGSSSTRTPSSLDENPDDPKPETPKPETPKPETPAPENADKKPEPSPEKPAEGAKEGEKPAESKDAPSTDGDKK